MRSYTVHDVDKLDPLFFRCGAPSLKPSFVEGPDDLVEGVFLGFTIPVAPRVGVLGFEFGWGCIETDRSTASDELASEGGFPPPGFPGGGFPGFPPGIHPGQIVIPQAADLTHEFRHQRERWLPPGFPGENASR